MDLLEKQSESLRRHHPKARMWVSPQSFDQEWLDEFLTILRDAARLARRGRVRSADPHRAWPSCGRRCPASYPIRGYPDITHSIQCQYPVPDWDLAFALTEGREVDQPPTAGSGVDLPDVSATSTIGFITYSEGCNDDVNKIVWSGLGWDPEAPVIDLLRQYARYFIGDRYADSSRRGCSHWSGTGRDRS